jgi:AcrR family transcriptional regulator
MPRAALTDEQIQSFRARAVAAATRLFVEQGYAAVTMRSLAAELGVSPMTPYRYFESKEALFVAVRTEAFRRFADAQEQAFHAAPCPEARLKMLLEAYVGFALAEPNAYCIMFELRQAPAGEHPELDAEAARSFSYLVRAFEERVEACAIKGDPVTLAHLAWAQVHGVVALHLAGKLSMGRSLSDLIAALSSLSSAAQSSPSPASERNLP